MTTHYETLGVSPDSTPDQIKSAYRELAKKYHPDKHIDNKDSAEAKFKSINEAYDCLKNTDSKAQYDYTLKNPNHGFNHSFSQGNFDDIFSHVFTNFSNGGFRQARQKNSDVHVNLIVTLEEAFTGTEKIIQYREHDEIKTLNVTIPKGYSNGKHFALAGESPKAK